MIGVEVATNLVRTAREAASRARCPYSKFHVGAAVLCSNGEVVSGCNVENASYGLTVCAERVALWKAVSEGLEPVAIAVSCPDASGDDGGGRMPCGACRQVMAELMPLDAAVFVDEVGERRVRDLLPNAFSLK